MCQTTAKLWTTESSCFSSSKRIPLIASSGFTSFGSLRNTRYRHPESLLRLFSSVTDQEEIDKDKVYQELQWLSREIRRHDALYYNNNNDETTSIIADDDYDALVKREKDICRAHPGLQTKWEQESGWGKDATRVGGRVGIQTQQDDKSATPTKKTRFQKRTHLLPMLSLDNVTEKAELDAWLDRLFKKLCTSHKSDLSWDDDSDEAPLVLSSSRNNHDKVTILTEPKLDGLSLSLRYHLVHKDSDNNNNNPAYELVWACTRGDGKKGQDVTQPVKEGMKLPTLLNVAEETNSRLPTIIEIRGEVVMPRSTFETLKEQAEAMATAQQLGKNDTVVSASNTMQRFSNARNAASGILLRKAADEKESTTSDNQSAKGKTTLELQSMLQFYAYDMVANNIRNNVDNTEWLEDALSSRARLQEWGFSVANPMAITTLQLKTAKNETSATTIETESDTSEESAPIEFESWTNKDIQPMLEYHEALGQYREELQRQNEMTAKKSKQKASSKSPKKKSFVFGDYDMDGCVHKVSQTSLRHVLGNSNRAPRWAIAHKFPSQSAVTALLDIEVQVGRKTGALTPVAILEPVELTGGVTVTRATLHNFQHMQQLFLGGNATDTGMDESIDKGANASHSAEATPVENSQPIFLGKGSKVLVRRAGDVIPQVVQLAEPPELATDQGETFDSSSWINISPPKQCPACGSQTVVDAPTANNTASKSERGQILRCSGPTLLCPPRAIGFLVRAYSRDVLDVSGLSEAKIQQLSTVNSTIRESGNEAATLVNPELIKLRYPSDVFNLAKDPMAIEAIASLPGWGQKSAQNLADTANKIAKDGVSLSRFINSLAIRFAGVRSSKIIATAYGSVDAFLGAIEHASQFQPKAVDVDDEQEVAEDDRPQPFELLADKENEVNRGIGPALLSALISFSKQKELVQAAKDLAQVVTVHDDEDYQRVTDSGGSLDKPIAQDQTEKPFYGLKVVFTGSLASMDLSRKDAQALAKSMGAKSTPGSISKSTDVVVVGEKGGGKKLDAASDLGVRILELDEFVELVSDFQNKGG